MKPRVLLVTSEGSLIESFTAACESRKIQADVAATCAEARQRWFSEETRLYGVVADAPFLTSQERQAFLQSHGEPGAPPLIFLDPVSPPDPRAPVDPVSRLRWPMAAPFLEALKQAAGTPMVFLADPTLYLTGMLYARLQSAGVHAMNIESTVGVAEMLRQASPQRAGKSGGSLWSMFGGGEKSSPEAASLSSTAIVMWKGDVFDAQSAQQRISQSVPEARFFLVSSAGPIHSAENALRRSRPAFLPRDMAEQALDLLTGAPGLDLKETGRVLLVDNFKPSLIQLSTNLMSDGYEVAACMKGEEAIELASTDRFHMAVVGAALAYAQHTGIELAQKLREMDPDLRIILMVDRYPLQTALQGVSQVVEVGLDDCLLKPVEPSRLKFSISRALERRRLLLENARLLEQLKISNEQLEQLTGFQSKFFAMVAHDVKNPLTAIRGYAELMSWKVKEPDLLKCVGHIQSSAKALEALVSDLVDYAAIESGKLRVNLEEMDMAAVVADVRSRIQVVADRRQIDFQVSVPEGLPKVKGDPLRIGQVIQNLCTNAIQYTPEKGTVYLKVQRGPAQMTISVRDTGIGISKEDLPRIFERFFQAQNAQKMRRAGFGLGLKISQEIVKAHGGGMGVDSELGKGSVFYFTLPVQDGPEPPAPPLPPALPGLPTVAGPMTPFPQNKQ